MTPEENGQNKSKQKTNTSGVKNITYHKRDKRWQYFKTFQGESHTKYFKNKIDAICYKFICNLKFSVNNP